MRTKRVLQQLTPQERFIVKRAMELILTGEYIEDFEFGTRLGVTRAEMALVSATFPQVEQIGNEDIVALGIHNALNEVCNGILIPEQEWQQWFGVPRDQVKAVLRIWQLSESV
jgi:hypothetical protein